MDKKTVRVFKNSKSKSLERKQFPETINQNKSLDFLNLYKSESETSAILAKSKKNSTVILNNTSPEPCVKAKPSKVTNNRALKKNNKNDTLDLSLSNNEGVSLNPAGMTSTPNAFNEKASVKSIMKNCSAIVDDSEENVIEYTPTGHRKKRNKSVSFRLEEEQATLVKKSKSEETTIETPKGGKTKNKARKKDGTSQYEQDENVKKERTKPRKPKKNKEDEKENQVEHNVMEVGSSETPKKTLDTSASTVTIRDNPSNIPDPNTEKPQKEKKKRSKKPKKVDPAESTENDSNNQDKPIENKETKSKKKKRRLKQNENTQVAEHKDANGEPQTKNRKKEVKPELIANDLENLKIGDNPHTLTDLLDDMKVTDKNKKTSKNKSKKSKIEKKTTATPVENGELEKIEEGKEKVVWKKRKWNKDKKSDIVGDGLLTSVIVENLPVRIMPEYRKILTEHFNKLGLIKNIGPAEVITDEDEAFATTIMFYSEGAATEALTLNNTELEGAAIRIKRPLPPTETTLVIRSYGALTEDAVRTTLASAGHIRNVKTLVKGKKSMATVFVEFDGPESVARALKKAEDARVGGKKIYVSRYDLRRRKKAASKESKATDVKTPRNQSMNKSAGDAKDSSSDSSNED